MRGVLVDIFKIDAQIIPIKDNILTVTWRYTIAGHPNGKESACRKGNITYTK